VTLKKVRRRPTDFLTRKRTWSLNYTERKSLLSKMANGGYSTVGDAASVRQDGL